MKVCFFGSFNEDYDRNWSIINGLASQGIQTIKLNSKKPFLSRSFELFFKALKSEFDILFVLYPGHLDVFTAKAVCLLKRKPLVLDKFVSQLDSELEYGNISRTSIKARYYWFLDKLNCQIADKVFFDTVEHADFIAKTFKIPRKKLAVIPAGVNESIFKPLKPKPQKTKNFQVLYFGITTPFHGFDIICNAANILQGKSTNFLFIGDSKHYREQKKKFSNLASIKFKQPVPKKELNVFINQSDICLGVFGNTPKIDRVIPLKVIDSIACGKPVITAKSIAVQKNFENGKEIMLVERNNSKALANAVLKLKNNSKLRVNVGKNARKKFCQSFSHFVIGKKLSNHLNALTELKF